MHVLDEMKSAREVQKRLKEQNGTSAALPGDATKQAKVSEHLVKLGLGGILTVVMACTVVFIFSYSAICR